MWISNPLNQALGLCVAAMMVAGGSWYSGYGHAKRAGEAQIAAIRQQAAADALAAEQHYSTKLAEAAVEKQKWFDFAQVQSSKLAAATRALDAEQARLKQEIPDALQRDEQNTGACHSGLGAHSLRLYNRAHGYAD